ncbi:hypothetical protein TL16_g01171 [Triparma laevis f. inornata]|uniref:Fibronectin type-III domain-containing protein n=1 Tax=Triparma laevis f. inornata TaxID=1714386 RepID=A0A9W7DS08_9STRA|nr:hypothetical protein TL16_g01171 [Triparma laevis f. inornata]
MPSLTSRQFALTTLFLSYISSGALCSASLIERYGDKSFDSMFVEDDQIIAQAYNECHENVLNINSSPTTLLNLCNRINYIHDLQNLFKTYNNARDEKDEDDDPDSLDFPVRRDKVFEFSNFFMDFEVKERSVKVEGMVEEVDFEELRECVKSQSSSSSSSSSSEPSDAAVEKKIKDAESDLSDIENEISELDTESEDYETEITTLNEDKESATKELKALKAQSGTTATTAPSDDTPFITSSCNKILEKATVPKYIYSSYLQRIPSSVSHVLTSSSVSVFTPDGRARESCPFGASAFYRSRGEEVGVRAFTKMEASRGLKPENFFKDDDSYEYAFSRDVEPFEVEAKENWGYKAGSLGGSDGLFVPSGHAVAFEKVEGAVVVRYCYVSASNLNSVKERLRVASHVAQESSVLLDTIESPGFDTKMERLAVNVKWEKFVVWPRVVEEEKSDEKNQGGESEKERRRKERRNKKKKNFGSWQAANAFDHKVMELTLPTLKPPIVVEASRRNATITWETAFEKREGDSGEISFEVEWEGRAADGETKLEGMESFSLSGLEVNIVTTKTSPESPPTAISSNVVAIPPKEWNEKLGRGEPYLPPHGTDATLLILSLEPPEDDGGMPVDSFDVLVSHADNHGRFDGDWAVADEVDVIRNEEGWVVLGVHHLTPGSGYSFRVAAVNAVGKGAWSKDSDVARTNKGHAEESEEDSHGHVPDYGHLLHGRGSGTRSVGDHNLLIVDDVKSEVARVGGNTVDVWTAHWSPNGFKSSGEFVEVQEGEKGEVMNVEDVDGRVAVVARGGTPLVRKVLACQRAGAVAVVIREESDRCVEYDQYCVYGANKNLGEGWGQVDLRRPWTNVRIPAVLVGAEGWAELMQSSIKGEEL